LRWDVASSLMAAVLVISFLTLVGTVLAAVSPDARNAQRQVAPSGSLSATPPAEPSLYAVSSPDSSHCWAVGEDGTVLATKDGGADWIKQDTGDSSSVFSAVCFPDPKHGWAVGEGGVILATSDGGNTWSEQASGTTTHLKGVSFVDAVHGWAVGSNDLGYGDVILSTTNGGVSWTVKHPKSGESYGLNAVDFVDGAHGWAAGGSSRGFSVVDTSDGGTTWWTELVLPEMGARGPVFYGLSFASPVYGWAVGKGVYRSGDGSTWGDVIAATTDGGSTWTLQTASPTMAPLAAVDFPSTTHGWAVGEYGILATSDGGYTWQPQGPKGIPSLSGVAFSDETRGWVVGRAGNVLATTDGGATWIQQYPSLPLPRISKVAPPAAKRNALFAVTGTNFGASQGASVVRVGGQACASYTSWSDTQIKCKVPVKASFGSTKLTVTTSAGTSNVVTFKVKR